MLTVRQCEQAVWEVEGIRIVIRAAPNTELPIDSYWSNAASQSWSLSEWRQKRLNKALGSNFVADIIGPSGHEPHNRTLLSTIRGTYRP